MAKARPRKHVIRLSVHDVQLIVFETEVILEFALPSISQGVINLEREVCVEHIPVGPKMCAWYNQKAKALSNAHLYIF